MPKKTVSLIVIATCIIPTVFTATGKFKRLSQEVSPRTLVVHADLFMSILNPPPLKHIDRTPTPPPLFEYTVSFEQQSQQTSQPLSPKYDMPVHHPLITNIFKILEGTPQSPLSMGEIMRNLKFREEDITHFERRLAALKPLEQPLDEDNALEYIDTKANRSVPTPRAVTDRLKNILSLQKKTPPSAEQIEEFTLFLHRVRVEDLDAVVDSERKWTLLHLAVWNNQPIYTHLLLRFKADPDIRDFHGRTPLLLAVMVASAPIIDVLLRYDANPNIQGRTDFGMVTPFEYIEQCLSC